MFDYDKAGTNAQPEVQEAIERFRSLPEDVRAQTPLLYWLLGEGTPRYKVSAEDSEYTDHPEDDDHVCGNCEFYYLHVPTGAGICSRIRPLVRTGGWCNLWAEISEDGKRERDSQDAEDNLQTGREAAIASRLTESIFIAFDARNEAEEIYKKSLDRPYHKEVRKKFPGYNGGGKDTDSAVKWLRAQMEKGFRGDISSEEWTLIEAELTSMIHGGLT